MLFNSYQFIFLYLPITLAVFALLGRYSNRLAIFWLALASLVFYGHWNLHDVPVLCASILFNFLLSGLISRAQSAHQSKKLLVFSLVANLGALAYYKYSGFAVTQLAWTGLDTHGFVAPVLPLVRAKVEHSFRVIKRQSGFIKVRYKGVKKNAAQLMTLFALSNLWMVRGQLMQAQRANG